MNQLIEQAVQEFGGQSFLRVMQQAEDFNKIQHDLTMKVCKEWLHTTLTHIAEEARKKALEEAIACVPQKPDLDLTPGFQITAEYRLGERRGWNAAGVTLQALRTTKI